MRGCAKSRLCLHSWSKQLRHSHGAVTWLTDEGGTTGKYTSLIRPVVGPLSCTASWYLISLTARETNPLTRVPPPTNDFHLRVSVYGRQTDANLLREIRWANYASPPTQDSLVPIETDPSGTEAFRYFWCQPDSLQLPFQSTEIAHPQSVIVPDFCSYLSCLLHSQEKKSFKSLFS